MATKSKEYTINEAKKTVTADLKKASKDTLDDLERFRSFGYEIVHRTKKNYSSNKESVVTKNLSPEQLEIFNKIKSTKGYAYAVAAAWAKQGCKMKDGKPVYHKGAKKQKDGSYKGGTETVISIKK